MLIEHDPCQLPAQNQLPLFHCLFLIPATRNPSHPRKSNNITLNSETQHSPIIAILQRTYIDARQTPPPRTHALDNNTIIGLHPHPQPDNISTVSADLTDRERRQAQEWRQPLPESPVQSLAPPPDNVASAILDPHIPADQPNKRDKGAPREKGEGGDIDTMEALQMEERELWLRFKARALNLMCRALQNIPLPERIGDIKSLVDAISICRRIMREDNLDDPGGRRTELGSALRRLEGRKK